MALDGQPLPAPEAAGPLVLAPGQRADLIVDVVSGEGEEAFLVSREREHSDALAAFPVRGRSRGARLPVPPPLPPNSVPALSDLAHARRETLRMDGGTMGRIRQAMLGGRTVGVRELAAQGKVWAFNGLAEMPDAPFFTADRGETVRLTMINDTAWPHGMHLHGHHFRAMASDGTGVSGIGAVTGCRGIVCAAPTFDLCHGEDYRVGHKPRLLQSSTNARQSGHGAEVACLSGRRRRSDLVHRGARSAALRRLSS